MLRGINEWGNEQCKESARLSVYHYFVSYANVKEGEKEFCLFVVIASKEG